MIEREIAHIFLHTFCIKSNKMVTLRKIVRTLCAKASQSPGLGRVPYSLEVSLFYAYRPLIANCLNVSKIPREGSSHSYLRDYHVALGQKDLEDRMREILLTLFQMPHLEEIAQTNFSETENILRLLGNSFFNNISAPSVLSLMHRFALTVMEASAPDTMTTADLIVIAAILQRDGFIAKITGARKARNAVVHAGEEKRRFPDATEKKSPDQPASGVSEEISSISDRNREEMLSRVYDLFQARLLHSAENGFMDDNITEMCKRPHFLRGFHAIQATSLADTMSYTEFSFFMNLLNERIKRKMFLTPSSPTMWESEEAFSVEGISASLIDTVGRALDRISLFSSIDVIGKHRALNEEEMRFIATMALSAVPSWSSRGLKAMESLMKIHLSNPRGPVELDVLSVLSLDNATYLRGVCLRLLSHTHVHKLAVSFMYFFPFFFLPTSCSEGEVDHLASNPVRGVKWAPSSTLHHLTSAQKKVLFSVARG